MMDDEDVPMVAVIILGAFVMVAMVFAWVVVGVNLW
jgi:hypothetical protein